MLQFHYELNLLWMALILVVKGYLKYTAEKENKQTNI